ncbi:MAG: hypothetical protein A3F90_11830 [Deltaproteobacteria bacterium RIFCSPLOWO2_12_FULL_60_19]|nr:MAG: hypothetical protein A3F90_11830 [Deltaproteobacteria bacterium RIFCSPLOWO2_12_FULL_60_19]
MKIPGDSDVFPTSFAQQRLWFLDRLEPGGSTYNVAQAFRLSGWLQQPALERSLNEIARRHEILRTTFVEMEGAPVQLIGPPRDQPLKVISLLQLPAGDRETEAGRLIEEEARRPFDLAKGPLFCATLLRIEEEEHILLLAMHHVVSDGWSMGVLYRELSSLYESFSQGKAPSLAELPIQYADFAVWQRQWLQGKVLEEQLSYWKQQLADVQLLELPTDHPRPAVQSYRGARQAFALPKALSDGLKTLNRREGATLFMTLLAAFQTLLHRYTGQDDIVVGSPVAGRNRAEVEGLIGFFVNTLVLRGDLSGEPKFTELMARVRKAALDAYEHQELPFEKLVEELQPERDLSRNPLFQVMFALNNLPSQAWRLPGLDVEPVEVPSDVVKFDLSLGMFEEGKGLRGLLGYNRDLFDAGTIQRMIGHFQTLLEGIAANPDRRLSELPILTGAERRQLLVEWNDTKRDYPKDKCIHELFEEQAARTPDAVAVVCEDRQLTYRELNRRANQLAHHLRSLGAGRETLVGICMTRSQEMVVGLLGILKAGGAYVALDPDYPKARLAFMMEDAPLSMLLTGQRLVERIPQSGARLICQDRDWSAVSRQSEANPVTGVRPDNLAYVAYTSGSTGRPKGAMIEHGSVVNYLCWVNESLLGDRVESVPVVTKPVFDASLKQLFAPLLRGRKVWVLSENMALQPAALVHALGTQTEVGLNCVPSLWSAALDAIDCGEAAMPVESIASLLIGGEQLSRELIRRSFAALPHVRIWNLYGPTEATANASVAEIISDRDLTIGRPIANTRIYILDARLKPVPIGVPGELHIGGAGLARGYLNRPERTADKFIPDPFRDEPGARFYKTGDLARYRPDGNIEFLGRLDDQVKIRGFRIEPGEIEAALNQHPLVRDSIVVARDDDAQHKRLIAYVVPNPGSFPTAGELRSFLKSTLPDYMTPAAFVTLEALPLTPNGKVNRTALSQALDDRDERRDAFTPPRSPVESALAEIFAAVLGVERVGAHDNFFDLGGHSLLAAQAVSRLRAALQAEISLRALFESPTVAGLAEHVETALRAARGQEPAPPLEPTLRRGPLPLSFGQQRLWFLDQLEPGNPTYNMRAAFRLAGPLHLTALERSLNEIVCRHEALRTTFAVADGQPFQVIASELAVGLPVANLQDYPEGERKARAERLVAEEARRPFDLARGPLLRSQVLRLGAEEHILVMTMHHSVSDGWSMGVFFRELSALYQAFSTEKPSPLPDLPIQYADFAVWQREWLERKVQASQLSYWRRQLAGAPPVLELPTDHPRPPAQTYFGAKESLILSKDLTEALKALSRREGATLFMTLLAAFQLLLSRYSGQDDIVVGAPIAGRNRMEIEGLIGFFLNNLALRTDLSGNPSFRELLGRVRRVALGAYTHQDLPFEKLLEELRPARDLSRTPLFQVYFNMNDAEGRLELPGLTAEPMSSLEPLSKFDFTLYVREQAGKIRFNLVYNVDIFERDRMVELLGQLEHLLSQIAENPDRRIGNFSLVTPAAEGGLPNPARRLDDAWKGAVHTQFTRQADRFPQRPAVVDRWGSWSYRETDARGNRIARYLRASGIGPRDLVAIYGHRSAPLVWAVLGVLKAGAAFVILDPAYPAARLVECLRAAKPRGWFQIAAAGPLPDALEKFITVSSIRCRLELSADPAAASRDPLTAYSIDDPGIAVGPDDLAYVAFTSGSTGRPKGILGRHGPLSHFLPWQETAFHLSGSDRFSMLSGLSHDPLQRDIFTPLWLGATILIPDPEIIGTPGLARWMAEAQVTFAHLTPAVAELLTETAAPDCRITSLRYAFFVGDKLTRRDVARLRRLAPEAVCIASYGSTETQRAVGYHMVSPAPEPSKSREQSVYPVGRGVEDAQLLVLTAEQQLAGVGELGEIHLRSPHLAQGYLGDEELTRARFLTNPFTGLDGDRLYKTGDMGRFLPDGSVEFVGRADRQVKIRGFRIEPGEIEGALCQHAAVREALVVAHEDTPGQRRLVAYIVPRQERAPAADDLRGFAASKLPAYMAPSAFVFLDALPLTPNGKVDRRALPPPDRAKVDGRPGYAAPTPGTIEPQLAEIWEELLGIHPIGTQDNFFELGGHSLLAVRMAHRIEQSCGERVPLATLLAGPTIEQLAQALVRQRHDGERSLLVKVQPEGAKPPFFYLHGDLQAGGFYCLNLAKYLGEDRPFYALAPHGLNGVSAPETVEAMAASYIQMARAVQPEGPYFLGGYCRGGIVAFEVARQLERQGQRVGLVVVVAAGARNTLPRRLLNGMVSRAGSWLGLEPRQRWRLFLGIRAWGRRVRRIFQADHYRVDQTVTSAQTGRDPAVARLHNRALGGYVSKPYSGRVALLWPAEEPFDRRRNPTFGWGRVTSQLEIRTVPGGHITCITEHLKSLAEHMKDLLEQVER